MRFDLRIIASLIEPGSRVLDLGCGEGELLQYLKEQKGVKATGIEKDEAEVAVCIGKGLSVLQGDFNLEVADYPPDSFDYIIISQTLQQVYEPVALINNLFSIGKKVVVSFPNFSHWRIRLQLLFAGYAPRSKELPYEWYDTPNIRVITLRDFRNFAREKGIAILKEVAINTHRQQKTGHIVHFLPNLRATYGIFLIGRADR
ncbi:MAG: methionine biosynthesis protein MetW [Deltaproteobacteria bacterium RIFOXYD12_FULL_56_24]|nr:MAG: methionine biosynthesis protein MetW [Deltaproteobacteria bacterium RIFOXYD12_FULL_56_24]